MYSILNNWSSCSALNHLLLIGKYLIYCKTINRVNFLFADFKALLHQKLETETEIHSIQLKQMQHFLRKMGQIFKLTNFNVIVCIVFFYFLSV